MDADQAAKVLAGSEVIPCMEGPLAAVKEAVEACLGADIPVVLGPAEACGRDGCAQGACGCGGAARVQVLVREEDLRRVGELMRDAWVEAVRREGTEVNVPKEVAEGEEPPCPACGTAAPLVEGACSDCGLFLG